jgi:hypothetical protein
MFHCALLPGLRIYKSPRLTSASGSVLSVATGSPAHVVASGSGHPRASLYSAVAQITRSSFWIGISGAGK